MMARYLIKIKPLMPYFFGGEVTLKYSKHHKDNVNASSYYAESENAPSQTTLFGTLRFVILEKADCLNNKNPEMARILVGENSFEFATAEGFGKIQKISSLFLINKDGTRYIKAPFSYVNSDGKGSYKLLSVKEYPKSISNSDGSLCYPVITDGDTSTPYSEKMYSFDGYMAIDEIAAEAPRFIDSDSVFSSEIRTGVYAGRNNKKASEDKKESKKERFFKKLYKKLDDKFAFAFYADLEEDGLLPESTVVFMGQGKSPFMLETRPVSDNGEFFEDVILKGKGQTDFYVAASDCFFETVSKDQYSWHMIKTAPFHHLTSSGSSNFRSDLKVSTQYTLIRSGSVFFPEGNTVPFKNQDDPCKIIGMNNFIKIHFGGNKE